MNNKLVLSIALLFMIFSIACAGQLTFSKQHFDMKEKNDSFVMGNDAIGVKVLKSEDKTLYYDTYAMGNKQAKESIILQQYINGTWGDVTFSDYSVDMDKNAHTVTKHYSNFLAESFDIIYYLADTSSPAKLKFNLWSLSGTYRIIWKIMETDKYQKIDGTKVLFTESNETDFVNLKIDYQDIIDSIGDNKIDIKIKDNEDGKADELKFIIGEFAMNFWDILTIDPQITSGHTTQQQASSILKVGNMYYISVKGDFESGTDDGAYVLKNSNFTNSSNWTKAVAMGGETAVRDNFIFKDNIGRLHFVMSDSVLSLQEKNSTDGTTWDSKVQVLTGTGSLLSTYRSPKSQLMPNGLNVFATTDTPGNDARWTIYNSTSDTFTSNLITATTISYGMSSFVNNVTNKTYEVWGADATNVSLYSGSSLGTPSISSPITIGASFVAPNNPKIYSYNGTLYLFWSPTSPALIGYATCPATNDCNTTASWTTGNLIDNAYISSYTINSILAIDNEGIFIIPKTNLTSNLPIYILNNNTWFRLDNATGITLFNVNSFVYLQLEEGNNSILMAYSDIPVSYWEVFSNEYILPDVLVKFLDSRNNSLITTNQTVKVYCGNTFIKTDWTTTGSIAVYPEDYSGCSTNSTTISLQANDFMEENLTITRTSNLNGYILEADPIGWNVSLTKLGCESTGIDGWDLFANNGTKNYTFTNQNSPKSYTTLDIDLTGNINFTFHSSGDDINQYSETGIEHSCTTAPLCYELYTLTNVTNYFRSNITVETKSIAGASISLVARVYWADGSNSEYSNTTTNTSYTNLTYSSTNQSKLIKAIHFYSTSANVGMRGIWFNYSKEYINKTISTTRPTNSLTQISESMNPYYFFYAIDDRLWTSRRNTAPINISAFYVTVANTTNSSSSLAPLYNVTNLSTELPTGSSIITFLHNEYSNFELTKTMNCSATGTTALMQQAGLQVQVYDETTLVGMTFNITIANTTSSTTFTGQTNPMWKNYTQIPTGDISISVSASGYEVRQYYRYLSTTDFVNLSGYLLSNTLGLVRSFQVVDNGYNILSGAVVYIYKFINNQWTIVAEKQTDDSGIASFLLNPSEYYQVLATYGNDTSEVQTIQPTESLYTIIITGVGAGFTEYTSIFRGLEYKVSSASTFIPETNESDFSFTVHPYYDDMDSFNMTLRDENGTILYTGNSTSNVGGVLSTTLDITNKTMVIGTFTMERDGESHTFTKQWRVEDMEYANSSLVNVLFNFSSIDNAELSNSAKSLIVLILTTAIMGTLFFSVGGFASAVIGASLITIATFFGWFDYRGAILIWSIVIGVVMIQRGI